MQRAMKLLFLFFVSRVSEILRDSLRLSCVRFSETLSDSLRFLESLGEGGGDEKSQDQDTNLY